MIVTKISEIKPRIHKAVFKCESCGHDIDIDQEDERELKGTSELSTGSWWMW